MPPAIRGGLLSSDFMASGLPAAFGRSPSLPITLDRRYARDRLAANASLGPASAARAVLEVASRRLVHWLGWMADEAAPVAGGLLQLTLVAAGAEPVALVVLPWARDPPGAERSAATAAMAAGCRWTFVTNGRTLRILDATRVPGAALDIDLDLCSADPDLLGRLHLLAGPDAFRPGPHAPTVLEHARSLSDAEGLRVCRALRHGVRAALTTFERALAGRRPREARPAGTDGQALTAVYRVLFLLFAEARGLVPTWHPIYRDGYTIAALAARIERGADRRGTWAALQAMARLAHAGCLAGDLRVTAFNSRLFSPSSAPLLDYLTLDDQAVSAALEALIFQAGPRGRQRIAYADLGVEQLGSVYERLLDDVPSETPRHGVSARKSSGTFYTPLSITDYLVRATLGPLVRDRSASGILALRVLDPSMGSGAFLVSTCRFLAGAVERALISEGTLDESETDEAERASLRRLVAQRCLFGVDANATAVQLGELSLWLATLAAEHPISFLEHHLRCGDSLIGAGPVDVMQRPPGRRRAPRDPLPLEPFFEEQEALAALLPRRAALEDHPDATAEVVHDKERALADLQHHPALVRWRGACDVWCALVMNREGDQSGRYAGLIDQAFGRPSALPKARGLAEFDRVTAAARSAGAFHWPLEFPEVFLDAAGRSRPDGGFDAVVGNPPWDMLRADPGSGAGPTAVARFTRSSDLYRAQSRGHTNLYQLFLERALALLRPGGRLGMLVPSGLLTDSGASSLRQLLLERHAWESVAVFDNRRAIFPIHRGLRFAAITAVHSGTSRAVRCRFGLETADQASALDPASGSGFPVTLTTALLRTLAHDDFAFPDLPSAVDAALVERLAACHPPLSSPDGWAVTFGRELNATEDRDCLAHTPAEADLVVLDGRHLDAFRARVDRAARHASRSRVLARLGRRGPHIDRPRVGYREVAAATNRTTLIAAVIPAGTVTQHTIFCCCSDLRVRDTHALCGLLNSYIANYLVRRWVTTHVTAGVMARLPVPILDAGMRNKLAALARVLARGDAPAVEARLQAVAARAYGISAGEFGHVLGTFPLVDRATRDAALVAFTRGGPR